MPSSRGTPPETAEVLVDMLRPIPYKSVLAICGVYRRNDRRSNEMAQKIRKKTEVGGLNQPDQVMESLQTTYGFLDKYKIHIVVAFVGVIVLLLAARWFVDYQEGKRQDVSKAYFEALKVAEAPVEGQTEEAAESLFKDSTEKNQKVVGLLDDFMKTNSECDIATMARSVQGAAYFNMKDPTKAVEQWTAVVVKDPNSVLAVQAHENLTLAFLQLGDREKAEKHVKLMQEAAVTPYLKVKALILQGDMVHPGVTGIQGEKSAEKAMAFYQEAEKLIPNPEDPATPDNLREAANLLKFRKALLNIS